MKKLFYSLVLCVLAAMPAFAQETITVFDGDATSAYVPVYGFYADAFNKVEFVMNANDLSEMQGATLTKMTWYLSTPAEAAWGGNFQIYLMEVSETTPTAYADLTGATLVWEGPLDGTGETIELEFANDFTYEGGNLLIAVHQTEKGTYKSASFAGTAATGAALQGYSYSDIEAAVRTQVGVGELLDSADVPILRFLSIAEGGRQPETTTKRLDRTVMGGLSWKTTTTGFIGHALKQLELKLIDTT